MKSNKQCDIFFLVRMTLFKRSELLTTSFFFIEVLRVTLPHNMLFWHILINLVAVKWSSWPWESLFIFKWMHLACIKIQPKRVRANLEVKNQFSKRITKSLFIHSPIIEFILWEMGFYIKTVPTRTGLRYPWNEFQVMKLISTGHSTSKISPLLL